MAVFNLQSHKICSKAFSNSPLFSGACKTHFRSDGLRLQALHEHRERDADVEGGGPPVRRPVRGERHRPAAHPAGSAGHRSVRSGSGMAEEAPAGQGGVHGSGEKCRRDFRHCFLLLEGRPFLPSNAQPVAFARKDPARQRSSLLKRRNG